jgi:hypothetical protein
MYYLEAGAPGGPNVREQTLFLIDCGQSAKCGPPDQPSRDARIMDPPPRARLIHCMESQSGLVQRQMPSHLAAIHVLGVGRGVHNTPIYSSAL